MAKKMAQRPPGVIEIQGVQYTVEELGYTIANLSERGEYIRGIFWDIHVTEWVEEQDYSGTETLQSLADEWSTDSRWSKWNE